MRWGDVSWEKGFAQGGWQGRAGVLISLHELGMVTGHLRNKMLWWSSREVVAKQRSGKCWRMKSLGGPSSPFREQGCVQPTDGGLNKSKSSHYPNPWASLTNA